MLRNFGVVVGAVDNGTLGKTNDIYSLLDTLAALISHTRVSTGALVLRRNGSRDVGWL